MRYNPEIHFLDGHYGTLLGVLSSKEQFENTAGCLKLITDVGPIIAQIKTSSDRFIMGRRLLGALRIFLLTCWDQKEREKAIHVLLISLYNASVKHVLWELWEDNRQAHSCKDETVSRSY